MRKFFLFLMLIPLFSFQGKVDCGRKVDTSQTSSAKFYTWYFWSSAPPCASRPPLGSSVSFRDYVYNRKNAVIVEVNAGTCRPEDVK